MSSVISPPLNVLQPCPLGKVYVLPGDFSCTLRTAILPVGKILCRVSDLSYALNTGKPAHWANSMSYPVIYPTLYVPETLPVGQIPPRMSHQGKAGGIRSLSALSSLSSFSTLGPSPPLPSPPLRQVSPSRRSERASERASLADGEGAREKSLDRQFAACNATVDEPRRRAVMRMPSFCFLAKKSFACMCCIVELFVFRSRERERERERPVARGKVRGKRSIFRVFLSCVCRRDSVKKAKHLSVVF
jgi:hypothetical protein